MKLSVPLALINLFVGLTCFSLYACNPEEIFFPDIISFTKQSPEHEKTRGISPKISPTLEHNIFGAMLVEIENIQTTEEIKADITDYVKNLSLEEKRELAKKGLWKDPNNFANAEKPDTPEKVRRWLTRSKDDERNKLIKKFDLPLVPEK